MYSIKPSITWLPFHDLQGIYAEIVGPTLLDLKDRVGANYEEISRTLVARSVGYFFSAVIGGTLADR